VDIRGALGGGNEARTENRLKGRFTGRPSLGAVIGPFRQLVLSYGGGAIPRQCSGRLCLGEPITAQLVIAGALMAVGVLLHLTEHHEHEHLHEAMAHAHPHLHDEHHRHAHKSTDPPGEPHTHCHRHGRMRHAHPHLPDMHHVHRMSDGASCSFGSVSV
jgi:hypothetical protein